MLVYNKMCWAITEPQREINLVTSFLSLFLNFHSGELGTSFQGGDPLQLLCILDWGLWGLRAHLRQGREETSLPLRSTQNKSWKIYDVSMCG